MGRNGGSTSISLGAKKVLIGDAPRSQYLVQNLPGEQGIRQRAGVSHTSGKARNSVKRFKTVGSFGSYEIRDASMCIIADYEYIAFGMANQQRGSKVTSIGLWTCSESCTWDFGNPVNDALTLIPTRRQADRRDRTREAVQL
jgi:hypothetical protein